MNLPSDPISWVVGGFVVLIVASYFIYLVPRLISAAWHRSRIESEKRKEQEHG